MCSIPVIVETDTSAEIAGSWKKWELRLNGWLHAHSTFFALLVLLLGLLLRLWFATGTFFNPDEAQHVLAATADSLAGAYRNSLETAHPPLLIVVLYFWRHLGASELILRLPAVIAGIAFCWTTFKWLEPLFGRTTAWIALILVTFLPPLVRLSAEVRQYELLLCFMAGAAYFLDRALAENSAGKMLLSSALLYLAMLSHYSALLFAAALGLYGFLRLATWKRSPWLVATWIVAQFVALGTFAFLYQTHISHLKGSDVAQRAIEQWMLTSYFHPRRDHLLLFIFARTFGVFQFLFGQSAVGDLAGLAFIIGIVLLLKAKVLPGQTGPGSRVFGIFLLLPFAINCLGAVTGLYPYGGTRHSVFLLMFAVAGVGVAIARWTSDRLAPGIAAAVFIVLACYMFGAQRRPYMTRNDQDRHNMDAAITMLRQQVPDGAALFVDWQSFFLLRQYACPDAAAPSAGIGPGLSKFSCAGHEVIATRPETWIISAQEFLHRRQDIERAAGPNTGDDLWVLQAGWDIGLAQGLPEISREFRDVDFQTFGRNISLFKLRTTDGPAQKGLGR